MKIWSSRKGGKHSLHREVKVGNKINLVSKEESIEYKVKEFRKELNTIGFGKDNTDCLSRGAGGSYISSCLILLYLKKTQKGKIL